MHEFMCICGEFNFDGEKCTHHFGKKKNGYHTGHLLMGLAGLSIEIRHYFMKA